MKRTTSSILLRSFWISLVTVIILLTALWFGGRGWLSQSVMDATGINQLSGLDAEVEVLFDQRGIPRIYSQTDADAVRALGWLHAGERLFQMELLRRVARGELAELIGEGALEMDFMHRSLGFARRVEDKNPELTPETRALVEAYVDGINAWIAQADLLPPEFVLLRESPRPWQVNDILTVAYFQSFYATTLVQRLSESWREITEHFGPEAADWLGGLHDWMKPSIPTLSMAEGSNTWVVAPRNSASGHALHASDPHLEYDVAPGMWYAAGLHSAEGLNVVGVSNPAMPMIIMGHNGQIAWALTVAPVDLFEIWRQRRHPEDPGLAELPDGWEPIEIRPERFNVRGREQPLEKDFMYTSRGRVLEADENELLVMQWTGFELPVSEMLESVLAINRAGDFDAFRHAATRVGALSVNWSYSDREGNIGYVQSTAVPKRRHDEFFTILDSANPDHGWDGFYPPEELPFALNPEQGWLANANNHAAGENWPYPIPGFYKHLRKRRITALLEQDRIFDADDMTAFQLDRVSDRALSWKNHLADIAEQSGHERLAAELREWDGSMRTDSEMAGLFLRWWHYLPRAFFDQPGQSSPPPAWPVMANVMDEWMHTPELAPDIPATEFDQAALTAFEDALRAGIRPLGSFQQLTIAHPMAHSGLLGRWLGLSRGPIPMGGDAASLNVTYASFRHDTATSQARAGASMRYVMDWADPDRFTLNLTMGQSGNPLSPHFDDFLPDFIAGQPWTVPWSQDAVRSRPHHRLILQPKNP